GFYHVTQNGIPTVQYGLLLPILIGVFLIFRSELARRILDAVPQPWIVGVQFYRALGVVFLILSFAGSSASLAHCFTNCGGTGLVKAWNVLGILDLTVAVDDGLSHCTVGDRPDPGSSIERTGDDAPHGDDPGLYGAALDRAAHRLAREIASRCSARCEREQIA